METPYTGPSAREMIDSHTLAKEIIARHNDPAPVFDENGLAILKRFVDDPSSKNEILKDLDMQDSAGDKPGAKANGKGSLAGYIVAQSAAGKDVLSEEEILQLRTWFAQK